PLRERGERTNRFDLVAPELDAERLTAGRREHVDETAAHRELSALVRALDALVAGERERLRQRLERQLHAEADSDRLGPRFDRRQRLGDRCGRRAHQAATREDVECTRALADEVGRRLEPGAPADATAREQRNPLVTEVPRRALRGVSCVRVLRREEDEAAAGVLV